MLRKLFLLPGDLAADVFRLPATGEHRQILRSFVNTMVWSIIGIGVVLAWTM